MIADLVGKGGHIRTIPVPDCVKDGIDARTTAAGITAGTLLRLIDKAGRIWGTGFTPKVVWGKGEGQGVRASIPCTARPSEDMRSALSPGRRRAGANSVSAWTRFCTDDGTLLGLHQRFRNAVNDRIGLEPDSLGTH